MVYKNNLRRSLSCQRAREVATVRREYVHNGRPGAVDESIGETVGATSLRTIGGLPGVRAEPAATGQHVISVVLWAILVLDRRAALVDRARSPTTAQDGPDR